MANIANRSPWEVTHASEAPRRFRLKSQALALLASLGYDTKDPKKLPPRLLKQLQTAFEVQITRKDSKGSEVKRRGTFDTREEAAKWAAEQENQLKGILTAQGGFTVGFETITVREALEKFHAEHYKDKASFNEVGYRIPRLVEWLGADTLFRSLNKSDMLSLKTKLRKNYSASSVRNYFTILSSLYTYASEEWQFPVENIARGLKLPKPNNAIQRYWVGDEEERLMKSLAQRSPWLIPIVRLSLEMAFRRGELVQAPVRSRPDAAQDAKQRAHTAPSKEGTKERTKGQKEMTGGLRWEHIDWANEEMRLPREKNDHTKPVTEFLGRELPISPRMREILMPLYEASPTKTGLVFGATINSVSNSFRIACRKADPPIQHLTFHSLRKIATKDLSRRVTNPMELGRLSGHRNIQVLNDRYYKATTAHLGALLKRSSGSIHDKGIAALAEALGPVDSMKFVVGIMALADPKDAFK